MRLRLGTIVGMIIIIGCASIVGRVVKVISLNNSSNDEELPTSEENLKNDFTNIVLGNSPDHLIWFLQVKYSYFLLFQTNFIYYRN